MIRSLSDSIMTSVIATLNFYYLGKKTCGVVPTLIAGLIVEAIDYICVRIEIPVVVEDTSSYYT